MGPFTFTRIRRRPLFVLLAVLLSAVFLFLLRYLDGYREEQEVERVRIQDGFDVNCVVSNIQGSKTSGLRMQESYIDYVNDPQFESGLYEFVRNVRLTKEFWGVLAGWEDRIDLLGVNAAACAEALAPEQGGQVWYEDWYKEDFFVDPDPVCLISSQMAQGLIRDDTGRLRIQLAVKDPYFSSTGSKEIALEVAGIYAGEDQAIYLPWNFSMSLAREMSGITSCDSMRFYVKDNRKLPELAAAAERGFAPVDPNNTDTTYRYALTIHDEMYRAALSAVEQNIQRSSWMQPMLLVLSLGVGFLVSFLSGRSERRSYALMRTLGVSGRGVYGAVFAEQLLLGICGMAMGAGAYRLSGLSIGNTPFLTAGVYFFCYILGCAGAVYRVTKAIPLQLLANVE